MRLIQFDSLDDIEDGYLRTYIRTAIEHARTPPTEGPRRKK